MRDVNDSSRGGAPKAGGWLHLDVSKGASGPMIAGALLHLGVDERVVRTAFDEAGLSGIGLRATGTTRGGVHGIRVEITDDAGRTLVGESAGNPARALRRAAARAMTARRRHQEPHRDARPEPEPKAMGVATGEEASPEEAAPSEQGTTLAGQGRFLASAADDGPPERESERPSRSTLEGWLSGEQATAEGLIGFLVAGGLAPLSKAIALRVSRRALEARARLEGAVVDGEPALGQVRLAGPEAALLLAEAIACAALIVALSPARVTASAVLLDAEPDPWVEAVLEGARAREEDIGFSPTTPLGAALVRALAHRFGPRGDVVLGRAGTGFGQVLSRGSLHVSRALYGEDVSARAREGGPSNGELARLEAVLDIVDRVVLMDSLLSAGALEVTTMAALDAAGNARSRVVCTAPPEAADDVSRILLAGAAGEVLISTVERRRSSPRE